MNAQPLLLAVVMLAMTNAHGDETAESKTVIGPRNIHLYDGAQALMAGDAEKGVRLTLHGLNVAQGQYERKVAHSNLCAGFLLLNQPATALEHCNWVLERYDNHWSTYNNRALVYLRLERFEEAEADIRKGQDLNPKSEKLKEVKGRYLDEVDPVTENIVIDDRRNEPPLKVEEPE